MGTMEVEQAEELRRKLRALGTGFNSTASPLRAALPPPSPQFRHRSNPSDHAPNTPLATSKVVAPCRSRQVVFSLWVDGSAPFLWDPGSHQCASSEVWARTMGPYDTRSIAVCTSDRTVLVDTFD
jgi:hypothetical protein